MTQATRDTLKGYFKKYNIPTEQNFADLIDSVLVQGEDGIARPAGDPLRITAAGEAAGPQELIRVYGSDGPDKPAWTLALKNGARIGLNISDGNGASRLFIDGETGNVGIGTQEPKSNLHIAGKDAELRLTGTGDFGAGAKLKFGDRGFVFLHEDPYDNLTIYARGGLALKGGQESITIVDIDSKGLNIRNLDGASRLFVDYRSGNVGIGSAEPGEYKLNVGGSLNVNGTASAPSFAGNGAKLTDLSAGNIRGKLDAALIPDLDAGKITSGMLNLDRIPPLPADKIIGALDPKAKLNIDGGLTVKGTDTSSFAGPLQVEQSIHIERASSTPPVIVRTYDFEKDEVGSPPKGFRVEGNPANTWQVTEHYKERCLRSGQVEDSGIQDNEPASLHLENIVIKGRGIIRFRYSTEENVKEWEFGSSSLADAQYFEVDGEKELAFTTIKLGGCLSPRPEEHKLQPGTYHFRWRNKKAGVSSQDDVWIYGIVIQDEVPVVDIPPHLSVGGLTTGLYSLADKQLALMIDGETRLAVDSDGVRATLKQEDWKEPVFLVGWKHFDEGGGNRNLEHVGYFKDSQGIVHLKGTAGKSDDNSANNVVFHLPPGYRPERVLMLPAITAAGIVRLDIRNDEGAMVIEGNTKNWISFDGISFRAAP